jgi:PAS domain S-box-containing protein
MQRFVERRHDHDHPAWDRRVTQGGWAGLFETAFKQSRNAMVLADDRRIQVDVNGAYLKLLGYPRERLVGQPLHRFVAEPTRASAEEWAAALATGHFTGEAEMICADGSRADVQWGATVEVATGRRLVLFVALSTSRWGAHFRRTVASERDARPLSGRERQIVQLIAMGNTGPEIADELQIAHDTVRTHVRNSMTKLRARSRAHLVANALGDGAALV